MSSPLDDAFRALSHPERRQLLLAIEEQNPRSVQSFDHLDDQFESKNSKGTIRMRLHHMHLPMLESAEIIEWHKDEQEITKGPNFDVIRPLLRVLNEESD